MRRVVRASGLLPLFFTSSLALAAPANPPPIRVKITKDDSGMTLPGYTFTQDSQDF